MTRGSGIYDNELADDDENKAAGKGGDEVAEETPDVEKGSSEPTA